MDFEKGKVGSSQAGQLLPHTSAESITSYKPKPALHIGWVPRVVIFLGAIVLFSRGYVARGTSCSMSKKNVTDIGDVHWWKTEHPDLFDGQIMVPMDYGNYSKGTVTLGLRRLKTGSKERKGTILLNPGGPGADGSLIPYASFQGLATARLGSHYDIVGFSPRGTQNASPRTQCFESRDAEPMFVANTVMQYGVDLHPEIGSLAAREDLIRDFTKLLAMQEVRGALCAKNMDPDILKYMGSTYVAQDVDFITTVLEGKDSLINFWGGSYGSILGAYVVNMFPNRVGRIGVDGIADAVRWAATPSAYWYGPWIQSADEAFSRLLDGCVEAGPHRCALLKSKEDTAKDLAQRIDDFLRELYYHPLPVIDGPKVGLLTSGSLRTVIELALEVPHQWPSFTRQLAAAMSGNGTELYSLVSGMGHGDMVRTAVTCADNVPSSRTNRSDWRTPEGMADYALQALKTYSHRLGLSSLVTEPDGGCEFWPTNKLEDVEDGTAVERFAGPWNHTLKNSILIYSNTADPITPLASAQLLHKNLEGSSALLLQNSAGHTTAMGKSLCMAKHSLRYFNEGILPPPDTICEVDETPFGKSAVDRRFKSPKEQAILDGTADIYYWAMGRIFE